MNKYFINDAAAHDVRIDGDHSCCGSACGAAAWEPTKPVEFIVPAGTGRRRRPDGAALQGIVVKNNLMKQPLIAVNKSGGAGAEGFLDVKGAKGDPHKIIITLSNLFTTPLATGVPFNWKDLTPVAMLALDQFVLWVNAETPYKTAKDYIEAVKKAGADKFKMARHRLEAGRPDHHRRAGEGRRHQVHLRAVQGRRRRRDAARRQARRLDGEQPDRGGGAVARGQAEAAVRLRRSAHAVQGQGHRQVSWNDIPTCKEAGRADRLPDAARHLHAGRRAAGSRSTSTSTCSRRCARRPSGRNSWRTARSTRRS